MRKKSAAKRRKLECTEKVFITKEEILEDTYGVFKRYANKKKCWNCKVNTFNIQSLKLHPLPIAGRYLCGVCAFMSIRNLDINIQRAINGQDYPQSCFMFLNINK